MARVDERTTSGRRRYLWRAVPAGLAVASLYLASSASAAQTLTDTFESGQTSGWSQKANTTVSSAYAREGSMGARSVSTANQLGYLMWNYKDVPQNQRYARVGGWIKIGSFKAGETVSIVVVRNAHGVNHFNLWRNVNSGRFMYDLYRGNHARSSMQAEVGRWYFVEALIDFGDTGNSAYSARVRIDGAEQPSIRSTGQVGTTVKSAYFGDNVLGNTSTRYYDNLSLTVSDSPLSFTR